VIADVDTSAAFRVLLIGPDPENALVTRRTEQYLDRVAEQQHTIVSSALFRTEILCQANRQPEIDVGEAEAFLSLVNLVALDPSDLDGAPNTPGRLRTSTPSI
jgi:uncharacterized protein